MKEDHNFIDTVNQSFNGKEKVLQAWRRFFELFPTIGALSSMLNQTCFSFSNGYSTSSYKDLDGPAIWTVKVKEDKVAEWQVYKDTPENRKLLKISVNA